jgi:hypothetical protein
MSTGPLLQRLPTAGAYVLIATLMLTQATPVHPACPENRIFGCEHIAAPINLPGAQIDDGSGSPIPWNDGEPCTRACYDLRSGILISNGYATPWFSCSAFQLVADDYTVIGIPDGTPLTFAAELHVEGTRTGTGAICAELSRNSAVYGSWPDGSVDAVLAYPLQVNAGEPFVLNVSFGFCWPELAQYGEGSAVGHLRFSGLPQGAAVVSCQSYDVPVPTHIGTWGRVKAAFR